LDCNFDDLETWSSAIQLFQHRHMTEMMWGFRLKTVAGKLNKKWARRGSNSQQTA